MGQRSEGRMTVVRCACGGELHRLGPYSRLLGAEETAACSVVHAVCRACGTKTQLRIAVVRPARGEA